MNNYVNMDTMWNQPVYNNQRGRMGLETMPSRFDPPAARSRSSTSSKNEKSRGSLRGFFV